MKTALSLMGLLLIALCSGCHSETADLHKAVVSFPQVEVGVYDPEVAARCANVLIQAGEERACAALLKAAKSRSRDLKGWRLVNTQVCHLCRLVFTSANSRQPLRRPMLGAIQGVPVESTTRDPAEWPDLPFVVADRIPLSLSEGYALFGVAEQAEDYLNYCRANGRFRTNLFAIPTAATASNALVGVFASPAWKALSRKDEDWGYYGNESEAKKLLWRQIKNVANQQSGANEMQPFSSERNTISGAAASRRSP